MKLSDELPGAPDDLVAFSIYDLEAAARQRGPGYLEAIEAIVVTREPCAIVVRRGDLNRLRCQFGNCRAPVLDNWSGSPGWGERLSWLLVRPARVLDRLLGTSFATCQSCAKRAAWLDQVGRAISGALRSWFRRGRA